MDERERAQQRERVRRKVRRTTVLLVLVTLAIYAGFIASGVMKAQP